MSGPLRVGVVGCGGIAQMMHLPTLAERPDLFSIVALADLNRATLEAVGSRYSVGGLHLDFRELGSRAGGDALPLRTSGSHEGPAAAPRRARQHPCPAKPARLCPGESRRLPGAAPERRGPPR